ncbi:MAG: hypothetical protein ABJ308_02125 [Halieaceae bacterium]
MTGCAATPQPAGYANHFSSAADDAEHSKCMSKHTPFNNRQLMMAPMAVENAWSYCVKEADVWYPGKKDEKTVTTTWTDR